MLRCFIGGLALVVALGASRVAIAVESCVTTDGDRAVKLCNEELKRSPYDVRLHKRRAHLLRNVDPSKSVADFTQAIRLTSEKDTHALADLHYSRGLTHFVAEQFANTLDDFAEVEKLNPAYRFPSVGLFARAKSYSSRNEPHKALLTLKGLMASDPSFRPDQTRDLLSLIESKLGEQKLGQQQSQPSPAATTQKQAVAQSAQSAVIHPPKGRRIALVIGNSRYKNAPLLPNPQRDATMVADALKRTGFAEVTLQIDLSREALASALQKFARSASTADWAVVYFAGHGMEIGGINYLIPVDATLETDRDVEFEAVPLNQVLNVVTGATALRLVVLDACRINPFANSMKRQLATRSVERGFARTEPNPGTLVVYAAKDGEVASDGNGNNSPFTTAFVHNLEKPGLEIGRLFRLVGDDVRAATRGAQTPYTYGALSGRDEFYFVDPR